MQPTTPSPACGQFLDMPTACDAEAVATVASGSAYFDRQAPADAPTPPAAVLALVLVLGLASVLLSIPTRRNGRRAN